MTDWQPIDTAPKDGSQILVRRDNGCGIDYDVVWWANRSTPYPWQADGTAFPIDRFDEWAAIPGSQLERALPARAALKQD